MESFGFGLEQAGAASCYVGLWDLSQLLAVPDLSLESAVGHGVGSLAP